MVEAGKRGEIDEAKNYAFRRIMHFIVNYSSVRYMDN